MKIKWIAAMLIFSAIHLFAVESSLTPDQLKNVEFKQNLNAEIPFDAVFYEEGKGEFSFGELMGEKPALLILGYDNCPMLCGLLFNGVFSTLQEVRLNAGKDFSVISVSIDPDENPKMTAARKTMYIKRYGRRAAKNGWAFLTGEKREIDRLAETVGFGYLYDPELEEYAHP